MGGVFNAINMDVYHYAGNNPISYIDPNGMERKKKLTDYILILLVGYDNWEKIWGDEMYSGFAKFGDKILFASIEVPADLISDFADYVSIGCIATGNVPGAATAEGISKLSNGIGLASRVIKALISGDKTDWIDAMGKAAEIGIDIIVSTKIKDGFIDVKVTKGKGGYFYQKGR